MTRQKKRRSNIYRRLPVGWIQMPENSEQIIQFLQPKIFMHNTRESCKILSQCCELPEKSWKFCEITRKIGFPLRFQPRPEAKWNLSPWEWVAEYFTNIYAIFHHREYKSQPYEKNLFHVWSSRRPIIPVTNFEPWTHFVEALFWFAADLRVFFHLSLRWSYLL